jgi:hypothetical protein
MMRQASEQYLYLQAIVPDLNKPADLSVGALGSAAETCSALSQVAPAVSRQSTHIQQQSVGWFFDVSSCTSLD